MSQKLHPTGDHIVVEPMKKEEKTASGIIIPDTVSHEKPQQCKVLAFGPGKMTDSGTRLEMDVKVGYTVLFTKYGPTEVKVDGQELYILNNTDILAVLK